MPDRIALDVAILLPPDVSERARQLSSGLPGADFKGLRLDDAHLPHLTLTQQFIRRSDETVVLGRVAEALRSCSALTVRVTGGGRGGNTVWMAVERARSLIELHEGLMDALREFECEDGGADAFVGGDGRAEDVAWVSGYRSKFSFSAYQPHITLGHAKQPPQVEPFEFQPTTVALCHLGRFCTCMRVLGSLALP